MKPIINLHKPIIALFFLITLPCVCGCMTKKAVNREQKYELVSATADYAYIHSLDSFFQSANLTIDSVQIIEPLITLCADSKPLGLQNRLITLKGIKFNEKQTKIKLNSKNSMHTRVDSLQTQAVENQSTSHTKPDATPLIIIFLLGIFITLALSRSKYLQYPPTP